MSSLSVSQNLFDLVDMKPNKEVSLKILILADEKYPAAVVKDHVRAMVNHSSHSVTVRAPRRPVSRWKRFLPRKRISLFDKHKDAFDVIIIHYSLCILFTSYIPRYLREN